MRPIKLTALSLTAVTAFAVGCSAPGVPARFSPHSPLSPSAREAPVGDPTVTLSGDPPLPGEPEGPWRGLDADAGRPSSTAGGSDGGRGHAH